MFGGNALGKENIDVQRREAGLRGKRGMVKGRGMERDRGRKWEREKVGEW